MKNCTLPPRRPAVSSPSRESPCPTRSLSQRMPSSWFCTKSHTDFMSLPHHLIGVGAQPLAHAVAYAGRIPMKKPLGKGRIGIQNRQVKGVDLHLAHLLGQHHPGLAQHPHMVGQRGLCKPEEGLQLTGAQRPAGQELHNPRPVYIAQRLGDGGELLHVHRGCHLL